ncbi:DUF362 domain-containing protein [Geothermobacter hydrogeniphilus]|uniref:(4Fe-4S)-binding protein n=1 Tax=Geothermobacter hydrogeniphilus TaxID=1969733 RepID=A0A1X0Y5M0_9BACT|nr:DUF362 domain-containing protein [Geothermobacter hydrogeniphilus]ORJ60443.1 (4Fe-4S)-binding protein [Geothermobacter hydrogeniphilus]
MNTVSLQALADYRPTAIDAALRQLLAPLGGIETFVQPGRKVLLKPNLLSGKSPDKAVTTHPEIVRAVIRLAQAAGGIVSVGDSPGLGRPEQVARKCGILQVIEETGARFAPFTESQPVTADGGTFHQLEIARDILDADVIINLPKLKTHQMMGLTCAVKNLFGAVVGMRKPRLHLQAGADKEFFALMLLELAEQVSPALTIVDAVVGMEGDGPGSGDPVPIGALLAGRDPVAVDTVAGELVGMSADQVWTWKVARDSGRWHTRIEELQLAGDALETLRCPAFRPAKSTDAGFGLPAFLRTRLKRALSARPVIDATACIRCGHCVDHCPPQAMQLDQRVEIDDRLCIRCFCCQELCPKGAIDTRQGWLLKLTDRSGH